MRKILSALFLLFATTAGFSQPKGYTSIKNISKFQTALTRANASVNTVTSDFTQVKNLALLSDKITSRGKFYFKKDDKVRIEYLSPFSYLLVMNRGQILVRDEQKTSKINTKNSKSFQSVNRIMIDCMRGTVMDNPDFKVAAYENAKSYLLALSPATDAMKKMFKSIDIYLDKQTFDVDRLSLKELGGDFTEMNFSNAQHNVTLNDALFKVK